MLDSRETSLRAARRPLERGRRGANPLRRALCGPAFRPWNTGPAHTTPGGADKDRRTGLRPAPPGGPPPAVLAMCFLTRTGGEWAPWNEGPTLSAEEQPKSGGGSPGPRVDLRAGPGAETPRRSFGSKRAQEAIEPCRSPAPPLRASSWIATPPHRGSPRVCAAPRPTTPSSSPPCPPRSWSGTTAAAIPPATCERARPCSTWAPAPERPATSWPRSSGAAARSLAWT
jgi:hypothetical protein